MSIGFAYVWFYKGIFLDFVDSIFLLAPHFQYIWPERCTCYCVQVWKIFKMFYNVLHAKSNRRLLKTAAIFLLNFVVKTALIWLVLVGFSCFFSQSETICNLHSCYRRTALLSQPMRIEYFFMYIINWRIRKTTTSQTTYNSNL